MADKNIVKAEKRNRIRMRIRKRVFGTAEKPRLTVYRSLNHIYAQLIDDTTGRTIAAASSRSKSAAKGSEKGKIGAGKQVGLELARLAKEKGVASAAFDRNGYRYHGRVKSVAEGAREGGLKF